MKTTRTTLFALLTLLYAAPLLADDYQSVVPLITKARKNIVKEPIVYPNGQAEVTSLIVTMNPGETTGWHAHGVPTYGYILEGELAVDYEHVGMKIYKEGTGFMEAMQVLHNGHNDGKKPVRILVVFMGAEGVGNVAK
ncbi:MAG: cupin domain-containing protein [Magnetococcales bacterium]|nr:cupin domain-containing protein [Magnetococcales bacterium]